MKSYEEDFSSGEQGKLRAVAKRLTAEIESEMVKLTINSPNWSVPSPVSFPFYLPSLKGDIVCSTYGTRSTLER